MKSDLEEQLEASLRWNANGSVVTVGGQKMYIHRLDAKETASYTWNLDGERDQKLVEYSKRVAGMARVKGAVCWQLWSYRNHLLSSG